MRAPFRIGGKTVDPGTRRVVDLPVSILSDHTPVTMSVHVVHGRRPGPVMFVSAAIHGDEVIGVEIVRRLLRARNLDRLRGTLLAVPIVNTFGFINQSRYLPDRRDLNRSFPGGAKGSLAARLANLFIEQVVARSDFGIDLHSAAIHRSNLPQVRIASRNRHTLQMAETFGAPLILKSELREGSLRQAALAREVDVLLYEAGEALRFDEFGVRVGVSGCLRVMHALGMIPARGTRENRVRSMLSTGSRWARAPVGGLLRSFRNVGDAVEAGDVLGIISDPFGEIDIEVTSPEAGLILGRSNLPVVNEGDALFHVARLAPRDDPEQTIERLAEHLEADPLFDEDEII
ncbi:MAG: succinylglutamate desuccinylase/aspartoacylase family protein [Pseudomonadota bacterium]